MDGNAKCIYDWIVQNPEDKEVAALLRMLEPFFDHMVEYEVESWFQDYEKFLEKEDEDMYNVELLNKFIWPHRPDLFPKYQD